MVAKHEEPASLMNVMSFLLNALCLTVGVSPLLGFEYRQ